MILSDLSKSFFRVNGTCLRQINQGTELVQCYIPVAINQRHQNKTTTKSYLTLSTYPNK